MIKMLGKEYYEINIKDNNWVTVYKVDYDKYNYFKYKFEYVYHTEKGETYPLEKDLVRGTDILIVDDEHLYELLDDLIKQGFCDFAMLNFINDYVKDGFDPYDAFF